MNTIRSITQALLLGLVFLFGYGAATAQEGSLLGLTTGTPLIDANPEGSCVYANGVLTIETQPFFITFDPAGDDVNVILDSTGSNFGGLATYTLNINSLGVFTSGTVNVTGLTSSTSTNFGPTLLTGDITDFGIRDGGNNDVMDIRADLTGGDLATLYPVSSDIATTLQLTTSTYTFSGGTSGFSTGWTCEGPKASIGPFGAAETCDLTITKTVAPSEIGPFPPVSDDSDSDTDSDTGIDHDGDGDTDNSDTDSGEVGESDSGPDPVDCGCKGKVSELTLKYNGPSAEITITRTPHDVVVFGPAIVSTGGTVPLVGPNSGPPGFQGTLGTNIEIVVTGGGTTQIHTSCSQPIGEGLIVGDWEVLSGTSKKLDLPLCPIPPEPCAGEIVTYTYTVTNGAGGSPLTGVQVVDDKLGAIGDPFDIGTGEEVVLMEEACITETTTNTATASGDLPSGELCTSNQASATVVVQSPPPPNDCPAGGGSDSDSGIDENLNTDTDDSDADSGDQDCDGDSDDMPPVPPMFEGCTPGYWKQSHHFDSWVNYAPGDKFEEVFVVDAAGNKTLLKVLDTGGGKSKALGRQAVAALLNASNPDVSYLYTVAEIQGYVQDAYASMDFDGAENILRDANERGCPLN